KLANWNLTQGRWKAAAERFYIAAHAHTGADMSDWEGVSFELLSAVTAVSEWGDTGQYERLRDLMIQRFADSANPNVAEHILKAALLQPAEEDDLRGLQPLVEVLRASLAGPLEPTPHIVAWRQFSLALMAYRQGKL